MGELLSQPPRKLGSLTVDLTEMMFYQYYPVALRECDTGVPFEQGMRLEPRLKNLGGLIASCWEDARRALPGFDPSRYYCYLTVKVGWATTENPLNRPGWHVDAWGVPEDISYVWCDRFPTRYITGRVSGDLSTDRGALEAFERVGRAAEAGGSVWECQPLTLYAFDQTCVHATPIIQEPGMRSFIKINLSPHKYNLTGNTKNHMLVYDWPMRDREVVRNHPEQGNGDFYDD